MKHSSPSFLRNRLQALTLSFVGLCMGGLCIGGLCSAGAALAQTRANLEAFDDAPERVPQLTVCSQNLQMYGRYSEVRSKLRGVSEQAYRDKEIALVHRMVSARCDVIAVQEIISRTDERGEEVLKLFADALKKGSGRTFIGKVGSSNDEGMRNAILVAADRGSIENVVSYHRAELPKLSEDQKPRFFGRGPLEMQIAIKPRGEGKRQILTVVNFHFKSRAGGGDDPSGLGWETYRMEMAEALRRIIIERHKDSLGGSGGILVVMGDRNTDFDSATAKLLDGTLALSDFQTGAPCRLGKRGTPLCQGNVAKAPILTSVLTLDPETKLMGGTYRLGKRQFWLDDILLPSATLGYAWKSDLKEGDFDSELVFTPEEASDHALVLARLYW